jgi:hypothetical protein
MNKFIITRSEEMQCFNQYYFLEKTIDANRKTEKDFKDPEDRKCISFGLTLAKKYNLILNGWMETSFYFTIPEGQEGEKNTFAAENEKELIVKLKKYQPKTFKEPDGVISTEIPQACDPIDLSTPEGRAKMLGQN